MVTLCHVNRHDRASSRSLEMFQPRPRAAGDPSSAGPGPTGMNRPEARPRGHLSESIRRASPSSVAIAAPPPRPTRGHAGNRTGPRPRDRGARAGRQAYPSTTLAPSSETRARKGYTGSRRLSRGSPRRPGPGFRLRGRRQVFGLPGGRPVRSLSSRRVRRCTAPKAPPRARSGRQTAVARCRSPQRVP